MSWEGFPVEGLTLLNDLEDQTQQLYEALWERQRALLIHQLSTYDQSAPADVPTESLQRINWTQWQSFALSRAYYYIDPAKMPGFVIPQGSHPYAGRFANPGYNFNTAAEVYAAAGLPPEGFTRKRPWHVSDADAPDGTYALGGSPVMKRESGAWVPAPDRGHPDLKTEHGIALPGDTIGPWLWNELKAVIDVLTHTYQVVYSLSSIMPNPEYYKGVSTPGDPPGTSNIYRDTPEAAIADALTNPYETSPAGMQTNSKITGSFNNGQWTGQWNATASVRKADFGDLRIRQVANEPDYDIDLYAVFVPERPTSLPETLGLPPDTVYGTVFVDTYESVPQNAPTIQNGSTQTYQVIVPWPYPIPPISTASWGDVPATPGEAPDYGGVYTSDRIYSGPQVFVWKFDYL